MYGCFSCEPRRGEQVFVPLGTLAKGIFAAATNQPTERSAAQSRPDETHPENGTHQRWRADGFIKNSTER